MPCLCVILLTMFEYTLWKEKYIKINTWIENFKNVFFTWLVFVLMTNVFSESSYEVKNVLPFKSIKKLSAIKTMPKGQPARRASFIIKLWTLVRFLLIKTSEEEEKCRNMTCDARVYSTMKLNYQSYANSSTLDTNRRAAATMTWANKTIYLYHFTARKKTFLSISPSWNIYLFLVTPRLTFFMRIDKPVVNHVEGKRYIKWYLIRFQRSARLCPKFPP